MENFKSSLPENLQKQLELGVNDVYNKFDSILHDKDLSNEEKNKQIDELINENETTMAYFSELKDLANDYLGSKYPSEEEYQKDFAKYSLQSTNDIKAIVEDTFVTKANKDDTEKTKLTLKELGVEEEIIDNLNSYQIQKIAQGLGKPSAGVEESIKNSAGIMEKEKNSAGVEEGIETYPAGVEENLDLEDLNLPKKDKERIKKQYQYKVDGKISSGLPELDDFLGIIQPGLDLILKTGAKLFYEGVVDNVEKTFLGNKEQEVKSDFEVWADRKKNLKSDYDFLHTYGKLAPTDTFKYMTNTDKDENHVATYFHQMIVDRINENRKKEMDEYLSKMEEYNKFVEKYNKADEKGKEAMGEAPEKPSLPAHNGEKFKGSVFDEAKDISETQYALQDIIRDVIRASRDKDADGNSIAKPTDKGKKDLEAIGHLLDLFNKKNSPEFKAQFSDLAEYYKGGYIEKYSGRFVENGEDYYAYQKRKKAEHDKYKAMLGDDGLDYIAQQAKGNNK